ncbi:carboxypeptidase-like regulatory domain-containing protein [Mucilaginibacter flavidus]|uniref:carboxypeptidase-like regulatory domain-containing protein n=1 Tax=Mucilaginibacter flavidus TaxID=2949309 RepID=UPI002092CB1D|nr:carboxypeptidase-like regulatory domain-containing protein [Mucilaginibacter flavidus]MCO5945874.1 carboxypeptidase-like regulatory domain-containing protein [Mucilaginibacter flavidus]
MKTFILTISLFFISLSCLGQYTISGRVINQADTKPVAGASVFLSNTTTGTTTAGDGTFLLQNVRPGKYDLVVSIVGFEAEKQTVTVGIAGIKFTDIVLYPKTIALSQVTVRAEKNDPERQKYLDKFAKEFLGNTDLARECKILNPELLDFHFNADSNTLSASSVDFLLIENKALGYRIKYLLNYFILDNSHFDTKALSYYGYILFEKMSGTPAQEKEWQKRRSEVYQGSQMHFLRSVVNNRIEEEGFRVLRLPVKADYVPDSVFYFDKVLSKNIKDADSLVTGPDGQGLYNLFTRHDMLYVSYNKYHHFNNSSYAKLGNQGNTIVTFNSTGATFDSNGTIIDPKSLTYDGAWARSGVAALLPVDYSDGVAATINTKQINTIINKLKAFADTQKVEKVYLHFDKPYYGAGDTVYFKAYVTSGGQHQLSAQSGILHVDLINPTSKLAKSIQLKLTNGLAWGDFALPDTLKGGKYRIRAYTSPMRNGGEDSFFEQDILIGSMGIKGVPEGGNTVTKSSALKASVTKNDIRFLPEGGSFIAGNYSRIAFKAVAPNGFGAEVKGTVTDDAGQEVCTFASTHLGMGAFNIVAREGVAYKANVIFADGSTSIVDLPKAVNAGYTLSLNNSNVDTIRLRITAAGGSSMDKLSLLAQAGGVVYYAAESVPGLKFFSAVIPKNRFPTGIVQFTLFNANGEPMNERLAFVNNPADSLKLAISAKNTYTPRQKVNIRLTAAGGDDKPVTGNFSVAVIDETNVPVDEDAENTILSNLLLTSELRGAVEQPNYYFRNVNDKKLADLDMLMLTQGYRSFEWKKILAGTNTPVKYQPEQSLQISGTVKRNGKAVPGAKVKLFTTTNGVFMLDTLTDKNGKFIFPNLEFADNTKFVVQSRVEKGQDEVTLDLDTPSFPAISVKNAGINNAPSFKNADTAYYMINQRRFYQEQLKYGINKTSILLKEVKVEAKKDPVIPHSENLNGSGQADKVLTAKDIERFICGRLKDCLQGVLKGIIFTRNGTPTFDGITPVPIYIDGTFVESDEFDALRPDDIEGIEQVYGPHYGAIYGARMANGGLIITTKRAKKINEYYRYAPGVVTYKPTGFYKAREFYSPQYDNPKTNQKMLDLRSTIYWNPTVVTGQDGKASFEFFNADGKGTYRVVVEGIDVEGNLGRQVYRYKVD